LKCCATGTKATWSIFRLLRLGKRRKRNYRRGSRKNRRRSTECTFRTYSEEKHSKMNNTISKRKQTITILPLIIRNLPFILIRIRIKIRTD
jgi:hypothetical protein